MDYPPADCILFLHRSCDIENMIRELARRSDAVFCPTKSHNESPVGGRVFGWWELFNLRRQLRRGNYALVVCCSNAEPLWRQNRFWLRNVIEVTRKILFRFSSLGTHLLPWLLRDTGIPLIVYDWEDNTIVAHKNWRLLDRSTFYFKTQCPRNPYKAFLFQDRRNDCLFNIVRQPQYTPWAEKIRPVSVGITLPDYLPQCQASEKKSDVFFAGSVHYSWVRQEGLKQLNELQKAGFKIDLPTERIDHAEFLRRCSQAWLVWSPEGAEWDCARHYWALVMGSVPLLNHPNTRRYAPLTDGVNAFYYGVEGDDLQRVIRLALADKSRLKAMAEQGGRFVVEHHLHSRLAEYMLRSVALRGNGRAN